MNERSVPAVVCFGEILWDLLPGGALPGGAPMNVAYHLHQLGMDPVLITRVGADERGNALLSLLNGKNIPVNYVQHDDGVPTGIVHAKADANGDMKYDIVAPAAWDFIQLSAATESVVKRARYFVFGSLIGRSAVSAATLRALLKMAQTKVLDINLRAPFYTREFLEELLPQADLVKMNEDELNLISNWYGSSDTNDVLEKASLVMKRFSISKLIITRGKHGALINFDGTVYQHPGYKVKVVDTVGSGDAFLAGFLTCYDRGDQLDRALDFACALGALVASHAGAWPGYSLQAIEELRTKKDV